MHAMAVMQADKRTFNLYVDGVSVQTVVAGADMTDIAPSAVLEFGHVGNYADGHLAEWAKWDAELSSEQITALAAGVRPVDIGTRPAWYVPMSGGLEEEIAGLAVTNGGTTISEHPPQTITAGNST